MPVPDRDRQTVQAERRISALVPGLENDPAYAQTDNRRVEWPWRAGIPCVSLWVPGVADGPLDAVAVLAEFDQKDASVSRR
jgi:hypothetical protein